MNRTAVYIGNFGYPDKNASGKRVLANSILLKSIGFKIVCVSSQRINDNPYKDIDYHYISAGNGVKRVLSGQISEALAILEKEKELECVILYGAIFTQKENVRIVSWCKKHRIAVFYDHVDWFEPNWHNPFRALVRIINYRILNKKVIPNCDGVICISDYLAEYHRKYHRKTVVVPPLSIETASNCTMVPKNAIQFIYAGTTSDVARPTSQWKDRLDIMFEGLANAQNAPGKRSFIVDVYGMSEEQYIMMFPEKERPHGRNVLVSLKDKVRFHGLVDNKETMKATRRANFSLLIRDVKRSTMVGLPTKVSESISCGTPVICTDTSDLTTYIKNGDNGFICSHESYVDTLKQVLSMTDEQLAAMKMNCSYNPFFFMNYKDRLISFLSEGKNVNI